MRFFRFDFLIAGVGAAVISTFSLLYYQDITKKADAGNAEVVGSITYKKRVAQRKYASQVVWEDVDQNSTLYNNDSIRTADMSEAVIHLKDGTEIALAESSMILLAMNKDAIDISFSQGSMSTNRGPDTGNLTKLNIKSGKASVSLNSGSMKLSQTAGKGLSMSVGSGGASVLTGAGVQELGKDQMAVIGADSDEVKVYKVNLKLVSPDPDKYFLTGRDKEKIKFSWESVEKGHDVFFEISEDSSFAGSAGREKTSGTFRSSDLAPGTYYWRISSYNKSTKKTEYSEFRKLSIIQDEPVNLISPAMDEVLLYRKTLPVVNFKWSRSDIASGYRLILAKDRQLKQIIKTYDVTDNTLMLDSLVNGTYFWKVEKIIGLSGISKPASSAVYEFQITSRKTVPSPELLYPNDKKQISSLLLEKESITFTWKNNPEYQQSKLFVAKDENFNEMIHSGTTSTNFIRLNNIRLSRGRYFWRVAGVLEEGEETTPSMARSFDIVEYENIRLLFPEQNAVLSPGENKSHTNARFSWSRTDIKGKYSFQISKDEKFASVFMDKTADYFSPSAEIVLDPGKYYWKVSLLDDEEHVLVKSSAQSFTVQDRLPLPVVSSPRDGYVVNMESKNSLELEWKKLDDADFYKVSLFGAKKKNLISEKKTSGSSLEISDLRKLDVGDFYWTIKAFQVGEGGKVVRESDEVKSRFSITLGKPLEKAKISAPNVIYLE